MRNTLENFGFILVFVALAVSFVAILSYAANRENNLIHALPEGATNVQNMGNSWKIFDMVIDGKERKFLYRDLTHHCVLTELEQR